jgi:hypothetical protein
MPASAAIGPNGTARRTSTMQAIGLSMSMTCRPGAAVAVAALCAALAAGQARAAGKVYPCRWVYVSRPLTKDQDVAEIRGIVRTAAAGGLNGMVLTGLSYMDRRDAAYFRRLETVKALCRTHGIEIIPIIYSAGYGGAILGRDGNLAAGLAVRDALFKAAGDTARLVADPPVQIANGGFENHDGDRLKGFGFHDRPGKVTFVDTKVTRQGAASLRFECAATDPHGHARVMQEIAVRPQRCYRLTCWVKTDRLAAKGAFRFTVMAGPRTIAPFDPGVPATADWRKVTLGFNSLTYDKVRVYAGAWGARSGRFWIDDMRIEEVGLLNVLRRPGTPVTVRDERSGTIYQEGRDFAKIVDPKLNFRWDRPAPAIRLLRGGRIVDGQRLRVNYYHGTAVNRGQVSVCLSEPKVYELWREQAELIHKHLAPGRYLLSMDEIRAGGSCTACKKRKQSMAEILGDCITRQHAILRKINPKAELLIWSDMLDPNHNARADYYLVEGDFSGSWKHVPNDLVIVCWYYKKRVESLAHFSKLGFRTLAGAYYDGDTLENPKGWLAALDKTPRATGIMYTTWRNKYDLLAAFGDLVSKR